MDNTRSRNKEDTQVRRRETETRLGNTEVESRVKVRLSASGKDMFSSPNSLSSLSKEDSSFSATGSVTRREARTRTNELAELGMKFQDQSRQA